MKTVMLASFVVQAFWLIASPPVFAQDDGYGKSFGDELPPELTVSEDGWVTTNPAELTLKDLRGHVVWLEFSYIECGGCRIMKPILQGLQRVYGPKGLVVIEINNGEIDERAPVVEQTKAYGTNYPLLWDKDGKTCDDYGVTTYGSAYLIGPNGNVIWHGNPIRLTILEMSMKVRDALKEVDLDKLKSINSPFLGRDIARVE